MPRRTWDIERAMAMRVYGYTYADIATTLGVAGESTIREALRRHGNEPRDTSRTPAAVRASQMRWNRQQATLNRILNAGGISNLPITGRTFGVEIEFHTAIRADVAAAVEAVVGYHIHMVGYHGNSCVTCGATVHGYTQWKLETDSSATSGMLNAGASPYNQGGELVSPVLSGEQGLEEIRKVMTAVSRVGAKVDRRHGLHVHIGASDLQSDGLILLYKNYREIQDTLYKLVAKSRKTNTYCKWVPEGEIEGNIRSLTNGTGLRYAEKYRGMNVAPLRRIGTVEMRMHQGTLSGKKATEWIQLLVALFDFTNNGNQLDPLAPLDSLLDNGSITRAQYQWLTNRIETLNPQLVNA